MKVGTQFSEATGLTASGSTQGNEFVATLAGGYHYRVGRLMFEPSAAPAIKLAHLHARRRTRKFL